MDILERLKLRTGESDEELLSDLIETAKNAILARRFPFQEWPTRDVTQTVSHTVTSTDDVTGDVTTETVENTVTTTETYVEPRYEDLQFRIALDLYNRIGGEGQTRSVEGGITREWDASWISAQLLHEVTPFAGVVK